MLSRSTWSLVNRHFNYYFDPQEDVIDLRAKQSEVVRQKSLLRGNEALKKFRQDREFEEEKIKHLKDMRTSVRIFEDDRARHIAALPPPKSLIIKNEQLILGT